MPEKGKAGKAGIGRSKKRKGEQKFSSTLGFAGFFVSSPPATSVSLIDLTKKKAPWRAGGGGTVRDQPSRTFLAFFLLAKKKMYYTCTCIVLVLYVYLYTVKLIHYYNNLIHEKRRDWFMIANEYGNSLFFFPSLYTHTPIVDPANARDTRWKK